MNLSLDVQSATKSRESKSGAEAGDQHSTMREASSGHLKVKKWLLSASVGPTEIRS